MKKNGIIPRGIITLVAVWITSGQLFSAVKVGQLTVERLSIPLGVETPDPRLGWVITSDERGVMQTAYHVQVASSREKLASGESDVWDSGKVDSGQSVLVPYSGKSLKPNQRYFWRVKVYTTKGESKWSDIAEWGSGLMDEVNWCGRWIGWETPFAWDEETAHSRLSSRYLRKEFTANPGEIKRATAHISGLGLYELFINGKRVGDYVLTPAPTDYRRTVLYDSYDVTGLLRGRGEANAIGVTLGNGRYYTMHQNHKPHKIVNFGYPKARLNLIIEYADGSTQRIVTDESWRLTAEGPIRSNNEYDGEVYDARRELTGWTLPGFDDSGWLTAQRAALPYGTLRPTMAPGMKVKQEFRPKYIRKTPQGSILVDFGQNMAGWTELTFPKLNEGDTVRIRYAERIMPDSTAIDTENLRTSESTDTYIANGKDKGTKWSPRFVYHGFQFVEIEGLKDLDADDITAQMVYDDLDDNGTFHCSDPVINGIYRAARMGIASNYKGMPVDCPQRDERQPWTGDHNMGAWGENFIFDNATLMEKWLQDMREAQREDGCIPDICPAFYTYYTPDMTWSSTLPVVADMLYEQTGDRRHIERNYDAIRKWMRFIRDNFTKKGLITADKYGDWCVPPESKKLIHSEDPARKTDGTLIASAYYCKMSELMAKFAQILGNEKDALDWEADRLAVRDALNERFLKRRPGSSPKSGHILYPDSTVYDNGTVTANLLPLAFGLVPEDFVQAVADNIVTSIINNNHGVPSNSGHISCGVIGVNWLMRELSRVGRGDVACMLATNTTYPSYGYMLSKGATTIWELWNGDTAKRTMNSCNHVMLLGDFVAWLYQDLGGINPAKPGYKEILLAPDFSIDKLTEVSASYNTPYGKVESEWHRHPMHLDWTVEIPCNTSAIISLPANAICNPDEPPCKGLAYEGTDTRGRTLWRARSGRYDIHVDLDVAMGEQRKGIITDEFIYDETTFPECHASTIAEMPDGTLVTAFFGGTKERNPDCCIWVSRKPKGASEWTAPEIAGDGVFMPDDPHVRFAGLSGIDSNTTPAAAGPAGPNFKGNIADAKRKACWNPVLWLDPETDELLLFYKIGATVGDWTGWVVRSKDGGKTWSDVTLSEVPNNNSGTDAVTLADGRHLLVYNDFATIPGTPKGPRTPLNVAVSDDGIKWRRILTLEDSPVSQYSYPAVIQGRDGTVHIVYTWRRQRIKHVAVKLPGFPLSRE